MPTTLPHTISPVGGWVMCLNAHGQHKDAAWDFMKWFASPAVHRQYALAGGTPSRISTLEDPEVNAKFPWTRTIFEAQKDAWSEVRPRVPDTFQLINTIGGEVNKAIIGAESPTEAMNGAQQQAKQLLTAGGELH